MKCIGAQCIHRMRTYIVHTSTFPVWFHLSMNVCVHRYYVCLHRYSNIWKDIRNSIYSTYETALNTNKLAYAYTHFPYPKAYFPCSGTLFQIWYFQFEYWGTKRKAFIALKFNVLSVKQTCSEWEVLNVDSN